MGRRRREYQLKPRGGADGIIYLTGTTPGGTSVYRSTGTRSIEEAARRLPLIVAEIEAQSTSTPALDMPLALVLGQWIEDTTAELKSAQDGLLDVYARHWIRHFETTRRICDDVALENYKTARLRVVGRSTVAAELSGLRRLHGWMKTRRLISALPTVPRVSKKTQGTPHPLGQRQTVSLDTDQMDAIVAHLPERSPRKDYPVREFVTVLRHTGLRPSTVFGLTTEDYRPGRPYVRIRPENDKTGFGRELPIWPAARAALDGQFPTDGPTIFPGFDDRTYVRQAAKLAGIDDWQHVSPYDFRHGRATELVEAGVDLMTVGYLLGHKHATTTNRYLQPSLRAAERAVADRLSDRLCAPEQRFEGADVAKLRDFQPSASTKDLVG